VSTPWMAIKGEYGTATLTDPGESLIALIESPGRASICQRYPNDWERSGVALAAPAAAHGPGAELCTEGGRIFCPHVAIECEQIDAYDLGLTDDPGCWIQEIPNRGETHSDG
jgi:hypothetical protein